MAAREFCVFIFNASRTSTKPSPSSNQSQFLDSLRALRVFTFQHLLYKGKYEVGCILNGTDSTQCHLKDYENLVVLREVAVLDAFLIKYLEKCIEDPFGRNSLKPSKCQNDDILDALVVAIDMLKKSRMTLKTEIQKKKAKFHIYLLSNFENSEIKSNSQKQSEICLNLIQEIKNQQIKVNFISFSKFEEFEFLKKVDGNFYQIDDFFKEFSNFKRQILQRPKFVKVPFSIGKIEIPITSTIKTANEPNTLNFSKETLEGTEVKRETCYFDLGENLVDVDDKIKAYKLGETIIPINQEDEVQIKYKTDQCLKLLAVVDPIPFNFSLENVECVKGEDEKSAYSLTLFIQALHEMKKHAVCRYAFKSGQRIKVKFVGLVPDVEKNLLNLIFLPFMEDIRHFEYDSLKFNYTEKMEDTIKEFVEKNKFDYKSKDNFNPVTKKFQNLLLQKLVKANEFEKNLLKNLFDTKKSRRHLNKEIYSQIKNEFKLRKLSPKKKRFNFDEKSTQGLDIDIELPETNDTQVQVQIQIRRIGTADPENDFLENLRITQENSLFEEMCERIFEISESSNPIQQMKAFDALIELRKQALNFNQFSIFNNFMDKVKFQRKKLFNFCVEEDLDKIYQGQKEDFLTAAAAAATTADFDDME